MGLIGKTIGLGKRMNGADLPVFLLEVSGANPEFYLFFKQKRQYCPKNLLCNIQLKPDQTRQPIASLDIIYANKRITKALIRLRRCAGWSAPLLFANPEDRFSRV